MWVASKSSTKTSVTPICASARRKASGPRSRNHSSRSPASVSPRPGSGTRCWRRLRGVGGRASQGITGVRTPPKAPTANLIAERIVRTIRTECLAHLIVIDERHLHAVLAEFAAYYNRDTSAATAEGGHSLCGKRKWLRRQGLLIPVRHER